MRAHGVLASRAEPAVVRLVSARPPEQCLGPRSMRSLAGGQSSRPPPAASCPHNVQPMGRQQHVEHPLRRAAVNGGPAEGGW